MFPVTRHPQNPLTGIIAEIPTEPQQGKGTVADTRDRKPIRRPPEVNRRTSLRRD